MKTKYRIKKIGTWEYLQYKKPLKLLGFTICKYWSRVPDYIYAPAHESDFYVSNKHWDGSARPKLTEFHELYPVIEDWFMIYAKLVTENK